MATKNGSTPAKKSSATKGSGGSKALIWTLIAVVAVIAAFLAFRPAGPTGDVSSVTQNTGGSSGVTNVDAAGVLDAQKQGVRVIDVRSTGEYAAGHIPGAENVPIDQFAQASQSWDKTAPLLVYCATGARSSEAVNILQQAGFAKIYHFDQGIQAWTGSLDTATSGSTAPPPATAPTPTTKPVMYEFYTDT